MIPDLAHVESWIFDLDNSLYPHDCNLFELIDVRMGDYIQRLLGVDAVEARRVQKGFFHAHGTTLAGLMADHGVDPHDFLDFVHDIDLARLAADPALVAALDRLPGRKFVFTNASEDYARRVLDRLGLANAFDGMHDIHAMDYVPKPDPSAYAAICERHGIDPGARLVRRRHGPQPRAGQGDRHDHLVGRQRLGAGARTSPSRTLSITGRPTSPAGWARSGGGSGMTASCSG